MSTGPYAQQPPPYQQQQPMSQPPRGPVRQSATRKNLVSAGIVLAAVLIAVAYLAIRGHGSTPQPSGTVTFHVEGDDATVTYGPAGSQLNGSSPMDQTTQIGNASSYFINAQLTGSGSVSCQIGVNGTVVSQASASADYGVAMCEIIRTADGWASATG